MPTSNGSNSELYEQASGAKPIITDDPIYRRGYEDGQNSGVADPKSSDRSRQSISAFLAGVFLTLILSSIVGIVLYFVFTPSNSSEESPAETSNQNRPKNVREKIISQSQEKLKLDL